MTKTVLFLGAAHQQLAPIEYAKHAGYRIVTSDNRPDNPGHRLADRSHGASTADAEAILRIAEQEQIDAVVCYATDVAAPTAAYVSEQLGIPGNPRDAVHALTNKARFRRFQIERGYFAPKHLSFDRGELADPETVQGSVEQALGFPVVVKPVDASGCKGVSKIQQPAELMPAMDRARELSISGCVIVEELVPQLGYQVCGEGFLQDGRIVFHAFANEHFCEGIVVPVGESFPCIFDQRLVDRAVDILQDMFSELGLRVGPFNFDLLFTPGGDVFVIEIGPRNGGNRIPEAIKLANQADTIAATVEAALGRPITLTKHANHFCSTYSVHAKHDGVLESIEYMGGIRDRIADEKLFASSGDKVERFDMGSRMIGNLILIFDTYTEMLSTMDRMDDHVRVNMTSARVTT